MANLDVLQAIRNRAENGDRFAQFEVATVFDYGEWVGQDFGAATTWYAKAADQEHGAAEHNLLLQHVQGQASLHSPEEVFTRMQARANSGDADAASNFGLCYQHGYGTACDYAKAAFWFRRAADGGSAAAQFNLGGLYFEGKGFTKDDQLAANWYSKSAEQRYELALIQLGSMYEKGIGVGADLSRSHVLYLIAYRRGSSRAAHHLASLYRRGLGVEQDNTLAFELYLKSVQSADTPEAHEGRSYPATAYYWLGRMTERGEGTAKNIASAKVWYQRGADLQQSLCIEALGRLQSTHPRRQRRVTKTQTKIEKWP